MSQLTVNTDERHVQLKNTKIPHIDVFLFRWTLTAASSLGFRVGPLTYAMLQFLRIGLHL